MSLAGHVHEITPATGWNHAMIARLLEVWDEYHLNDMKAYDLEMKAAGWDKLARTPMHGYAFTLTKEAMAAKSAAKEAAMLALRKGETFTPTPEQVTAATLAYEVTCWEYADRPEPSAPGTAYERARDYRTGAIKHPERKTLGWVYPKEHPDGLLGRKLRADGPGYGSNWYTHPIPVDVVQWLHDLPAGDAVLPVTWAR
jgi:hypothetical protein